MKTVADTNVIAYFLLDTEPFQEECRAFWRAVAEALAPASWEAELTNVLWMAVRAGVVDLPGAVERLDLAKSLGILSVAVPSLWHGALQRPHTSGIAAYDTLFVELAERETLLLATFDEAVLRAFPEIARRPRSLTQAARRARSPQPLSTSAMTMRSWDWRASAALRAWLQRIEKA